eukprot:CAMPEP_0185568910 /NCGR_PEP_ID=MMETSP0434-20130131/1720_1 /TAXON_ID=626734 ORGANISM="Favella taraikaensis, Strain Fe Narragansett Bay" /NCGR_SAMPLE_ID=MMETSP0434 /ASSEMBLY_ACC=CAM_ASM_000379 /LENGTH=83 /DNA_ID=CAMNT_0028183555 /DNA_START=46 /DNA_END=294 /DNA_ORIENTATION=-
MRMINLAGFGQWVYFCDNTIEHNLSNMLLLTNECSSAAEALTEAERYTLVRETPTNGREEIRELGGGSRLRAALSDNTGGTQW